MVRLAVTNSLTAGDHRVAGVSWPLPIVTPLLSLLLVLAPPLTCPAQQFQPIVLQLSCNLVILRSRPGVATSWQQNSNCVISGLLALSAASPQQTRRRGRQSVPGRDYLAPADTGYGAPADEGYGAPAEAADEGYGAPEEVEEVAAPSELDNSYLAPAESAPEEALDSYGAADEELSGYGALDAAASDEAVDMGLKMLMTSVPGVPGEDYPIYAEVPESAFTCEGQVEGGKMMGERDSFPN